MELDVLEVSQRDTLEETETIEGDILKIEMLSTPITFEAYNKNTYTLGNSILNLNPKVQAKITLTEDWMHPAGFDFSSGISTHLIGQIVDENFNIYVTYHKGSKTTFGGGFFAEFYYLSVFSLEDELLDQLIIAGNENLKDGGVGHNSESICKFNEGLSFSIKTKSLEYDHEDGDNFEEESITILHYQIQTDGIISVIPE